MKSTPQQPITLTDLSALITHFHQPKDFLFALPDEPEKQYSIKIRRLTELQLAEMAGYSAGSPPTIKQEIEKDGKKEIIEAPNFLDDDWRKRMEETEPLRKATALKYGLPDFHLENAPVDEARDKFFAAMPRRVIDAITERILQISATDVQVLNEANLSSAPGSARN